MPRNSSTLALISAIGRVDVHCVVGLRRYRRWDLDVARKRREAAFAFAPASYGTIVLNLRDEAACCVAEEQAGLGEILEAWPLQPNAP